MYFNVIIFRPCWSIISRLMAGGGFRGFHMTRQGTDLIPNHCLSCVMSHTSTPQGYLKKKFFPFFTPALALTLDFFGILI